jgi:hypothetical protein
MDQVAKLLKDLEVKEKRNKTEYQSVRVLLLANMFKQYDQYVTKKQWKAAHDSLVDIITLFTALLVKSGDKSSS